jgi:hypothetical protein
MAELMSSFAICSQAQQGMNTVQNDSVPVVVPMQSQAQVTIAAEDKAQQVVDTEADAASPEKISERYQTGIWR